MKSRYRLLSEADSVVVAIDVIKKGTQIVVGEKTITVPEDIPQGHKIAVTDIFKGENIIKYGFPIGKAKSNIKAGSWVHTHNCETNLKSELKYQYMPESNDIEQFISKMKSITSDLPASFMGYRRKNGKVGIRNEIWIIPTVGCVNQIAEIIAKNSITQLLNKGLMGASAPDDTVHFPIDGVFAFSHPYGCSQLGDDHETTKKILADLALHPNAAGVLVLGLGCENNNIKEFKKMLGDFDRDRIKFLSAQDAFDEIDDAVKNIIELAEKASEDKREEIPVSELVVGLKCGGSDGFSGITANPLLGAFSDRLVALGGTTILTEVPEMFGAETILMRRAVDENVFKMTVELINNFKQYFLSHNQVVYENPSPGNKDGGITTLEDKSLGCVQKGGRAPVAGVLDYGERVASRGLVLLSGPGNDIVSVTALAAAGAHLVLFTTGRGTPLGGPVPTVKVSSNSALADKKAHWIDFDAGRLIDIKEQKGQMLLENTFFNTVIEIASGKKSKNEINGYREIAIFKDGVTL